MSPRRSRAAVASPAAVLFPAAAVLLAVVLLAVAGPALAQVPPAPSPVGGAALGRPGVVVDLPAGVPAPPAMPVASYVVADMGSGAVIAASGAHLKRLPASTLKVLAALVLLPRVTPSARVVAAEGDVTVDGTKVGLLAGNPYSGRQLFQAMLMSSGNDATYALARAGGGVTTTVAAMNAEAAQLGAFDTVAADPSGLDRPGQTSSAYDLALIGRAAMLRADFRSYVATRQVQFPGGRRQDGSVAKGFLIGNHNRLLYNYPGTVGVKNGYTVAAKQTFIGAATRAGRTYLVAWMGGTTSSWRPTAALLDWAFASGAAAHPVGVLVARGTVAPPAPTPTSPPATGATPSSSATTPGVPPSTEPSTPGPPAPSSSAAAAVPRATAGRPMVAVSFEAGARTWLTWLAWLAAAGLACAAVVLLLGARGVVRTRRRRGPAR